MFIYKIENKVNGKVYIGLTTRNDVNIRWNEHIWKLNSGIHHNRHLQNAWNKYKADNFDFSVISEYSNDLDTNELAKIEKRTIALYDSYNNGYNLTTGGDGTAGYNKQKGRIFSDETKRKMSESQKGKEISKETRKKISESLKGRYVSEKTRDKLRDINLNRYAKINKRGEQAGKQAFIIYKNEKELKYSLYPYKLLDWFIKEYPNEILILNTDINDKTKIGTYQNEKTKNNKFAKMNKGRKTSIGNRVYSIYKDGKILKSSINRPKLVNWFIKEYPKDILILNFDKTKIITNNKKYPSPMKGKHHSEKSRKKMSESHKGKKQSKETIRKRAEANTIKYARILKGGYNSTGKREYRIRYRGKVLKTSVYPYKLIIWFRKEYPNKILKLNMYDARKIDSWCWK